MQADTSVMGYQRLAAICDSRKWALSHVIDESFRQQELRCSPSCRNELVLYRGKRSAVFAKPRLLGIVNRAVKSVLLMTSHEALMCTSQPMQL